MGIGPSTIDVKLSHESKKEETIHDKYNKIKDIFKNDQHDECVDIFNDIIKTFINNYSKQKYINLIDLKKDFKLIVQLINSIIIEEGLIKEIELEYEENPSEELSKELNDFKDFNKNMKFIEDNIDSISFEKNELSDTFNLVLKYLEKKSKELDSMKNQIINLNNKLEQTINMLNEVMKTDN